MVNAGILKNDEKGALEAVTDPEETEMLRLSAFDDAESQQAASELSQKITSKRQARVFHIDGIDKDKMEEDNAGNSEML